MTVSTTEGSAYVMNPKPLGRPVCRSFIITLSITSPYFSKYLVNVSNVVSLAKPPMKILPGLAPSTSETPDFFGTMTELKRSNHDDGSCGRRCSGSQTRVRKIRA
uniref:Uncharacterized protein n=1 Tax=Opuntia streptacantha TaxID=393608 RepID=A0A7C9AS75_OPUST